MGRSSHHAFASLNIKRPALEENHTRNVAPALLEVHRGSDLGQTLVPVTVLRNQTTRQDRKTLLPRMRTLRCHSERDLIRSSSHAIHSISHPLGGALKPGMARLHINLIAGSMRTGDKPPALESLNRIGLPDSMATTPRGANLSPSSLDPMGEMEAQLVDSPQTDLVQVSLIEAYDSTTEILTEAPRNLSIRDPQGEWENQGVEISSEARQEAMVPIRPKEV